MAAKKPEYRCFEVMQFEYHPDHQERNADGSLSGQMLSEYKDEDALLTKEKAIETCERYSTIKQAAIFVHDADVYNADDEEKNPKHKRGWAKPKHWHIYLRFDRAQTIETIAKWFGVQPQYVKKMTGHGAFVDGLEYGFHESPSALEAGKHIYGEESVVYTKDCNPRRLVDELQEKVNILGSKGRTLLPADELRFGVQMQGMTLLEAENKDPITFGKIQAQLKRLRGWYLCNHAPLPIRRTCIYITGAGGIGKGILCRALARSLTSFMHPEIRDERASIFTAGGKGVALQEYDGQPCIIFNDRRAYDFIEEFGSRQAVFDLLDPSPTRTQYNIKYGSTTLANDIVIINGIDDKEKFLDGLSGEYTDRQGNHFGVEDKSQSYRRFPFIIEVQEEVLDLFMNKGIFEGTREYFEYIAYQGIRANMRRVVETLGEYSEVSLGIQKQICAPIVDKYDELNRRLLPSAKPDLSEFADYGTQCTMEQLIEIEQKSCNARCCGCRYSKDPQRKMIKPTIEICNDKCKEFVYSKHGDKAKTTIHSRGK